MSANMVKEEEEQPTAEDAANTLAQLAGFRSFHNSTSTPTTYQTGTSGDIEVHGQSVTYMKPEPQENDIQYQYDYSTNQYQVIERSESGEGDGQTQRIQIEGVKVGNNVISNPHPMYMTYVSTADDTKVESQIVMGGEAVEQSMEQVQVSVMEQSRLKEDPQHIEASHLTDQVQYESNKGQLGVTQGESTGSITSSVHNSQESHGQILLEIDAEPAESHINHDQISESAGHIEAYHQTSDEHTAGEEVEQGEEFAIETVTLQEIAEAEESPALTYNVSSKQAEVEVSGGVTPTVTLQDDGAVQEPSDCAETTMFVAVDIQSPDTGVYMYAKCMLLIVLTVKIYCFAKM